jgi:hypothetical protein
MSDFLKLSFDDRELAEQANVLRTQGFDAIRKGQAHGIIEKDGDGAPRGRGGESRG